MATYEVTSPDGKKYRIEAPDTASPDEVKAYAEQNMGAAVPSASRTAGRKLLETDLGTFGSSLLNVAQGPTFGFADEIIGAGNALKAFAMGEGIDASKKAYEDARDYVRGANEAHKENYPVATMLGQASGGMLYGGPIASALKYVRPAASILGRTAQAGGIGAAGGALGGAGGAQSIEDIPEEAALGAMTGAAFGGGLQGTGSGIAAGGRAVAARVPQNLQDIMGRLTGTNAVTMANRRVAEALARDEVTAEQAAARLGKRPDAAIADVAGENTRNLLDTTATLPGKTQEQVRQFIRRRIAERPDRMDVILDDLNQGGWRFGDAFAKLQKIKEDAAAPLYAAVRDVSVPTTGNLQLLMERPVMKSALAQAETNAANRNEVLPDITKGEQWTVGTWDKIKRSLDDVIGRTKRGLDVPNPSNKNAAQSTLSDALDTKRLLVSEIDRLTNDKYKAARDAFAGPAALQSAMEDGLGAMNKKAAEIGRDMMALGPGEQEAYRLGAAEALRDRIGSQQGQTRTMNAWKDRNTREQLRAIYGDDSSYRRAMATIGAEERMKRLEGVGQGSQTARREAGMEDFNAANLSDAVTATHAAATGSPMGAIPAARRLMGRVQTPEAVRNEIGKTLLMQGQEGRAKALTLGEMMRDLQRQNAESAAISGVLGGNFLR